MIFCIRDRASGWYLSHGPEGFKLTKDRKFAYLVDGDPDCKDVRHAIVIISEGWGENRRNGLELITEPVIPGAA